MEVLGHPLHRGFQGQYFPRRANTLFDNRTISAANLSCALSEAGEWLVNLTYDGNPPIFSGPRK